MTLREIGFTEGLDKTLHIMQEHGLLLTSADQQRKPNVMAIGWAAVGAIWGKPIFTVLVRPSRHTFSNIEATGEFAVNVPTEEMHEICMYCGSVSGRDVDKFAEKGLTLLQGSAAMAPLIRECTAYYECKVVHKGDIRDAELLEEVRSQYYEQGDLHRLYYGQIVRAAVRS